MPLVQCCSGMSGAWGDNSDICSAKRQLLVTFWVRSIFRVFSPPHFWTGAGVTLPFALNAERGPVLTKTEQTWDATERSRETQRDWWIHGACLCGQCIRDSSRDRLLSEVVLSGSSELSWMSRPVLLKRQGWCLDFCLALKRELQAASGNHNLSWPHQLALLQDTQPWIFQSEIWWFTTRFHQIPSDSQAQITSKMMVNIGRPPENDGAEGPRIYFQQSLHLDSTGSRFMNPLSTTVLAHRIATRYFGSLFLVDDPGFRQDFAVPSSMESSMESNIHKTFGGGIDTFFMASTRSRNSLRLPGAIGSRCTAVLSLLTLEGAQLICSKRSG